MLDKHRFDAFTRTLSSTATRRRGIAALLGAFTAGVVASTPADAKRGKTRCKHVTCRGACCKRGQYCTLLGCTGEQNMGVTCFDQYACSTSDDCRLHNDMWHCQSGHCCVMTFPQ